MSPALAVSALLTLASGSVAPPRADHLGAPCCTAIIRVRVPAGTGTVFLAGSLPQLGPWRPDAIALTGTGRERTAEITVPPGTSFEYKFTLGAWNREVLTASGTAPPNYRLVLERDTVVVHELAGFKRDPREYIADWRGSGVLGRLVLLDRCAVGVSRPYTTCRDLVATRVR